VQRSGVVLRTPACPPDDAIDHAGEQEHSNYIMCHVLRVDVCATGAKVMVPSCCIVRNVVQHNCTTPRVILGRWCRWLAAVVPWWVRKALKAGSEEEGLRLCRAGAAHAAAGEHHVAAGGGGHSGLTAVDGVVALRARGHRGVVYMLSRHGPASPSPGGPERFEIRAPLFPSLADCAPESR